MVEDIVIEEKAREVITGVGGNREDNKKEKKEKKNKKEKKKKEKKEERKTKTVVPRTKNEPYLFILFHSGRESNPRPSHYNNVTGKDNSCYLIIIGGTVGPVVTRLLAMQKVLGSNPTIDKNLYSFFDGKYFNGLLSGVLVLT
ncbi:hypothetical protein M8J77_002723 [Diaphorina citri]|nr:hypothetical protein M8J77_002723 [Diaphorina citri]